jgi:hypothetical protein
MREALMELAASGRGQEVTRHGKRFWAAARCHFPKNGPD